MGFGGRKLRLGLLTVVPAVALTVSIGGTAHADQSGLEIKNANSGKCLDVRREDGFFTAGARVQQYTCTLTPQQLWSWHYVTTDAVGENVFRYTNDQSGMCMEVRGRSFDNGAQIQQNYCNGGPEQLWIFTSRSTSINFYSRKCLDISGASRADLAKVQQWDCNGTGAQVFNFE